jgi:hypothetical protein
VGSRRTSSAGRDDEVLLEAPHGEGLLLRVGKVKPSSTRVGQSRLANPKAEMLKCRLYSNIRAAVLEYAVSQ